MVLVTDIFAVDFLVEIFGSLKFFFDYARGKPSTHTGRRPDAAIVNSYNKRMDFGQAFGVDGSKYPADLVSTSRDPSALRPRASYDEEIHLASYPYSDARRADSVSPIIE